MTNALALCEICGEPMPDGEEMFKFHGFSCECPKPPLPRPARANRDTPLWAVSVQGPDDLIAVADYLTAVRVANAFNTWWARLKAEQPLHEYDPRMWAVPVEWIGDIASHVKCAAKPSPDYAPFFEARSSQDAETIKALREALGAAAFKMIADEFDIITAQRVQDAGWTWPSECRHVNPTTFEAVAALAGSAS